MKQNDIWLVNLDPTVGAEIRKIRPAIIVNDDALGKLPLKIIVPITDWKDRYEIAPWMVKLTPDAQNNLLKVLSADCFQVRSLAQERLIRKVGEIDKQVAEKIKEALKRVLTLD